MARANMWIYFWIESLISTTFVCKCVPTMCVASTPYELWTVRKPDFKYIVTPGIATYVDESSHKYGKLDPRGKNCIFICY